METQTQALAGTVGVTINDSSGQITIKPLLLASGQYLLIKLNNSTLTMTDVLAVSLSGAAAKNFVTTGAGVSADGVGWITVGNHSGGTLLHPLTVNFDVLAS